MHPHRSSALGYASAASAAHSRVYGACAAEAAASESSRLSVGGCIRSRRSGQDPSEILGTRHNTYVICLRKAPTSHHAKFVNASGANHSDLPRPLTDLWLLFRAQDLHGSTRRLRLAR